MFGFRGETAEDRKPLHLAEDADEPRAWADLRPTSSARGPASLASSATIRARPDTLKPNLKVQL